MTLCLKTRKARKHHAQARALRKAARKDQPYSKKLWESASPEVVFLAGVPTMLSGVASHHGAVREAARGAAVRARRG